MKCKC